jgi:hypothetical protein
MTRSEKKVTSYQWPNRFSPNHAGRFIRNHAQ